jgi:nitrite reductase (NADH) small subunit
MHIQLPITEQKSRTEVAPIHICSLEDLPLGLGRAFDIPGQPAGAPLRIALFRTRRGQVFAVDNRCPHKGGPLAEGMLAGDSVVCPLHAFRYELNTGDCDQAGACPIATYPVTQINQEIYVSLPPHSD